LGENVLSAQETIRSHRLDRMAALAGAGARVGMNYLKHYGRQAISGRADADDLQERNASEVFRTFSELKGGPLKLAQMLSIDQSLLPPAYAKQFARAQYSAPPLSYPLVVRTFRREFGKDPREVFDTFEPEAAHAASIGQVHRATRSGRTFAVKIQYPGVAESLRSDLGVVKPIALQILGLRERDVAAYFREVEARLLEETDYEKELASATRLSAACAHLSQIRFPEYHPEFSNRRVITMDWMDGEPFDVFADGPAHQDLRDSIGQALWDFYAHQIHNLHTFHADPHPGNFLVHGDQLCVLDFGCTKSIDANFHAKQFAFLDPALETDPARLAAAMESMAILLPTDSPAQRDHLVALCRTSLELLARPFRNGEFDFGDQGFMSAIYELGEENRKNDALRGVRGQRGSADTIYLNRTFFGLYSLLTRLRARVKTPLPAGLVFE
jgi:predicted unusual protein kinase regulating ubiquinone biosynthesis (AarF/ABC1/UbiB family)